MSRLSDLLQKNIYRFIWLLSSLLVVIIIWIWAQPLFISDDQSLVAAVQSQLEDSFIDEEQSLIDPTLTVDQVNDLIRNANKLRSYHTVDLQEKTKHLVEQFNDLQTTAVLFNVKNHHAINWQSKKYPRLAHGMTKDHVKKVQQSIRHRSTPQFQEWVDGATGFAQEVLEGHQAIETGLSQMTQERQENASLTTRLETLTTVGDHWWTLDYMDDKSELEAVVESHLSSLSEEIVESYDEGLLDDTQLTKIFEIEPIANKLSGSHIDPRLLVSLTFDDGPHPDFTPQVLEVLAEHNIKATFFVMGGWVEHYPEIARRVVEEGHIIANHTYTHPDLSSEPDDVVRNQVKWATETIQEATGVTPTLFRMPFGSGGARVVKLAQEYDLTSIIWNVDSADWMLENEQEIYDRVMRLLEPKSLILMHDTSQRTVDAIKRIIPELKDRGYQFVDPTQVGFNERYFEDR